MDTPPRHARPGRAVALALVAALSLGGCAGLRVESPAPATPSAGPAEQARQDQAEASARILAAVETLEPTGDEPTAVVSAGEAAQEHLTALGGVWQPFPSDEESDGTAEDTSDGPTGEAPEDPTDPMPSTPAALVALLAEESGSALDDAAQLTDGRLARLIASIGVQRRLAAEAVAAENDLDRPQRPSAVAPAGIPTGLSADALASAIVSEDALGLAWEVQAARSSGDARDTAATRAAAHRERAQAWAEAAGVVGTESDPRRAAYRLPTTLTDREATAAQRRTTLAGLEADLAAVWLDLAAQTAAGSREPLLDVFTRTARTASRLQGAVPSLPGMPEAG